MIFIRFLISLRCIRNDGRFKKSGESKRTGGFAAGSLTLLPAKRRIVIPSEARNLQGTAQKNIFARICAFCVICVLLKRVSGLRFFLNPKPETLNLFRGLRVKPAMTPYQNTTFTFSAPDVTIYTPRTGSEVCSSLLIAILL